MVDQVLPTKERILEAAADVFGSHGFRNATIRKIAKAAEVNIAAINYHFRNKEGLYLSVLDEVFHTGFSRFPADMDLPEGASPEERLRAFIRSMFYRLHSEEGWDGFSGKGKLIARELLNPSPAFDEILDKYIRPHKDLLTSIIADIMRVPTNPELLTPCAISIIGQCIYYALGSSVIKKISGNNAPSAHNLDQLADFVWQFSLGGIENSKNQIFLVAKETQ